MEQCKTSDAVAVAMDTFEKFSCNMPVTSVKTTNLSFRSLNGVVVKLLTLVNRCRGFDSGLL